MSYVTWKWDKYWLSLYPSRLFDGLHTTGGVIADLLQSTSQKRSDGSTPACNVRLLPFVKTTPGNKARRSVMKQQNLNHELHKKNIYKIRQWRWMTKKRMPKLLVSNQIICVACCIGDKCPWLLITTDHKKFKCVSKINISNCPVHISLICYREVNHLPLYDVEANYSWRPSWYFSRPLVYNKGRKISA